MISRDCIAQCAAQASPQGRAWNPLDAELEESKGSSVDCTRSAAVMQSGSLARNLCLFKMWSLGSANGTLTHTTKNRRRRAQGRHFSGSEPGNWPCDSAVQCSVQSHRFQKGQLPNSAYQLHPSSLLLTFSLKPTSAQCWHPRFTKSRVSLSSSFDSSSNSSN